MAFNVSGGYAAGAGGDALEGLWQLLARQHDAEVSQQHDAQRIKIAQQNADDNSAIRKQQQESMDEARAATAKLQAQQGADKVSGSLAPGSVLDQGGADALRAGDLGSLIEHQDSVLPSTSMAGIADASPKAPSIRGRLITTENAGHGEQDVYKGTGPQQETDRKLKLRGRIMADPNTPDPVRRFIEMEDAGAKPIAELFKPDKPIQKTVAPGGYVLDENNKPVFHAPPTPHEAPTVLIQTVDENGNPVTKMVQKHAGDSYAKPANATTATRVSSAETVNQVGNDIIHKLSDPAFMAAVGPAMGRSGTLRDFIGNPPPEFSELAGQIESYALANMGVHGMRSAQGAEAIKKLLDQRHTPESLAATIRGLNDFSTRFVQNNKPKAGGAAVDPAAASRAADLIKKYGG